MNRPSPRMKRYIRAVRTAEREGRGWRDGGGACGTVSEVIQVCFGWPQVEGHFGQAGHAWNVLPDGSWLDGTADQFGLSRDPLIVRSFDAAFYCYSEDDDY